MKELIPFFKALGDKNRVTILVMLMEREHCVCELMDQLSVSQSTVSHHLKIMKESGLVNERSMGKWNYYSINRDGFVRNKKLVEEKVFQAVAKAPCKIKEDSLSAASGKGR